MPAVTEAKLKDFQSTPRCFWKTLWHFRRGKQGTIQAMYNKGGTLLTSAEEVLWRWKEHFEKLLNLINSPSTIKAELEDDGGSTSVFLEKVTYVVTQLCSGKAPGIDEIQLEMQTAVGVECCHG